jgi:hypothetical protein
MKEKILALLKNRKTYTIAWLVWGAYFVVVEAAAILFTGTEGGSTLSEHVWDWVSLGEGEADPYFPIKRLGFFVFWGWLTIHFLWGGRFLTGTIVRAAKKRKA